jgi:hypothetical protein
VTRIRLIGVRLVAAALPLLLATAPEPPAPWSQTAMRDLIAMHDLIRDNHPGPIDPQNPGFHIWLDGGETALLPQARKAASLHDYQTVLRDYANGFGDGHLSVVMNDPANAMWPGFLVRADAPDSLPQVSVIAAGPDAPRDMEVGDTLIACGGVAARSLLEDRVLRPLLNPHVPQRLVLASAALMVADADDQAGRWPSCVLESQGRRHTISLHWRPIAKAALTDAKMRSSAIELPATGLRHVGDVWLISMPSFSPEDRTETQALQGLVTLVTKQAAALHAVRHVVLDLRGNDSGDAEWGVQIAEALWGKAAVQAVEMTLPTVIDWRVSVRNAAAVHGDATMFRQQGQPDGAAYFDGLARRMDRALRQHDVFMREPADPAKPMPKLNSPFLHPVYVLTTPHCASACLDFLDLLNGLPGTVRVGLETSSDTDYLEVAKAELPSGHATLHYAMKVYRERKRGANVSDKPVKVWPGGEMNDSNLIRWIDGLGE